tara:strand:+ start:822 stop:1286 length:465 start_codon:yes stop_codon:yes gene_type:complete
MNWLVKKAYNFLESLYEIPTRIKNGYQQFYDYSKNSWQWVHREVASIMNGPIPKNHEVHHIDHNKRNNNPDNLQVLHREEHQELHRKARLNTLDTVIRARLITDINNGDYNNIKKMLNLLNNAVCSKCGGRGYLAEYKHIQEGVCFNCKGHPSF